MIIYPKIIIEKYTLIYVQNNGFSVVIKVENWNQLNICQQGTSEINDGSSFLMPDQ